MNNESRELLFDITRSVFVAFFIISLILTPALLPLSLIFLDIEMFYTSLRSLVVLIWSASAIFILDKIK